MKKFLLLILMAFTAASCSNEDYDLRTYFDVEGVGYVYNDLGMPVCNAKVVVWSEFRSNGYATVRPITEEYITNQNGYYCVKFLKRTQRENVIKYSIWAEYSSGKSTSNSISLLPDEIKYKNVIHLDTLIF